MSRLNIDRLQQHLFASPEQQAYALVDCARDPAIHRAVIASLANKRCLFVGKIDPILEAASPFLLALSPHGALTQTLLEHGLGQSWGIFLHSPLAFDAVYRHFRGFLRVRTEEGKTLLFRYYDPRVARTYLPTCTIDEREHFFGPVTRFFIEQGEHGTVWSYENHSWGLVCNALTDSINESAASP